MSFGARHPLIAAPFGGFHRAQRGWITPKADDLFNESAASRSRANLRRRRFVGGININPRAMVSPGREGDGGFHDAYVGIAGPSATDVHHNFAQRWNEASERTAQPGVCPHGDDDDLSFPMHLSQARRASLVQIQRNIHAGL
jgi:phosphatidylserine/phosphatidylglycerophosphate/cardiolipin synthase-like enzyme